jgi:hypothetical protein
MGFDAHSVALARNRRIGRGPGCRCSALVRQFTAYGVPVATRLTGFPPLSDSSTADLLAQPIWGPLVGDGEGNLSSSARAIRLGAGIASFELKVQPG